MDIDRSLQVLKQLYLDDIDSGNTKCGILSMDESCALALVLERYGLIQAKEICDA